MGMGQTWRSASARSREGRGRHRRLRLGRHPGHPLAVETEEEEREVVPEAGGPHSARGMQGEVTQADKGGLGGPADGDKDPNVGHMGKGILGTGSRPRPGENRGIAKTRIGGKVSLARTRAR